MSLPSRGVDLFNKEEISPDELVEFIISNMYSVSDYLFVDDSPYVEGVREGLLKGISALPDSGLFKDYAFYCIREYFLRKRLECVSLLAYVQDREALENLKERIIEEGKLGYLFDIARLTTIVVDWDSLKRRIPEFLSRPWYYCHMSGTYYYDLAILVKHSSTTFTQDGFHDHLSEDDNSLLKEIDEKRKDLF